MAKYLTSVIFAVLAVLFVPRYWVGLREMKVYDHPRPYYHLHDVWTPTELSTLRSFVKQGTFKTMPRNTHAREMEVNFKPDSEGNCPYDYLVKMQGDVCAPIGRLDALMHLARYGGTDGYKESVRDLMNTVHVFQMFQFNQELQRPEIRSLMQSEQFQAAADAVCSSDSLASGKRYPFRKEVQVNINLLLPGQQLPVHKDVPYFKDGGVVENFPLWLLGVMQGAGLWDSDIPPHVQGQAYLHLNDTIGGGGYFFYPDGPGAERKVLKPVPNSAIVVDASRVFHGVERFLPERKAPPLFNQPAIAKYKENEDIWEVRSDKGDLLEKYRTDDLRITFIWRTLCFETEEERDKWHPKTLKYNAKDVLQVLEDDLRHKGVLAADEPRPSHFEFAMMLIDEYIRYPVDNMDKAWIPYNYCMIPYITTDEKWRSILDRIFQYIC